MRDSSRDAPKPDWHILLLGGTAAVGKSTCARQIAREQGIDSIDVDTIWIALGAATTAASHPPFHHFDRAKRLPAPEVLVRRHIESAEAVSATLGAVVAHQCEADHSPAVIEGAWITPAFAAQACSLERDSPIRAVFIGEPDREALAGVMRARRHIEQGTQRQHAIEEMSWLYGNWLAAEAGALGLPVVDARPRSTLVRRILRAAAHSPDS